ncbi:MAG: cyclic nucleotide-binding domain-containing protein [Methylovulum miyakonense]|uniref:Crp/Fnr family transcriptional regulator n=1 Tax=Methylovulum miyakonense TaxID=645578 RepID=UPI00036F8309|nr:cyclic nucleotide-binding domain-containing protein [Methylovulum miyakonense]
MINLAFLLDDPDFTASVQFTKIKYRTNDVILKENEISQDVYFILDGQVQISTCIGEEVDKILPGLARLSKGDFFGELAMFDGEPRSAEVTALTECEIAKVDGSQMLSFMEKYPEKGYFVLRELFMNLVMRIRQNNLRTKTVLELYLQENSPPVS